MVPIELREYLPYIINHKLGQLSVMILYNEAKEFAIFVVNDVSHLLFEREGRQLLKLKFGVVLFYFEDINFILNVICLFGS